MIASGRASVTANAPLRGLFITGTDTGVGKTVVMEGVVRFFRRIAQPVCACKPVATGARQIAGRWVCNDTIRLAKAAGIGDNWEQITPFAWPESAAPPVAARVAGATVNLEKINAAVRQCAKPGELLLAEGVGGLLCPLTETETVADLAVMLGLPLIVVTRRSLGTLNHTLLTLEAAARRGLRVAGIVVNETTPPNGLADETNVEELRRRVTPPILAVLPYQATPPIDALPALAAVDWRRLCFPEEQLSAWKP
jgi:dethiobiotin synthetase